MQVENLQVRKGGLPRRLHCNASGVNHPSYLQIFAPLYLDPAISATPSISVQSLPRCVQAHPGAHQTLWPKVKPVDNGRCIEIAMERNRPLWANCRATSVDLTPATVTRLWESVARSAAGHIRLRLLCQTVLPINVALALRCDDAVLV